MRIQSLLAVGVLALAGCAAPPPPDYAAQHKPGIDAIVAAWSAGKFDGLDATLAANYQRRSVGGLDSDGVAGFKKLVGDFRTSYPDAKVVIDESFYLKDVSFHRWTFTGTNTGPGAEPPTGKSTKVSGSTLMRYQDGKIAEENVWFDTLDWYKQLGYTVTSPSAAAAAAASAPAKKK